MSLHSPVIMKRHGFHITRDKTSLFMRNPCNLTEEDQKTIDPLFEILDRNAPYVLHFPDKPRNRIF
jgi:hypothetical protein